MLTRLPRTVSDWQQNQCDGCMRGLPVDEHRMHRGPGGFWAGDMQLCTRDRYLPSPPAPEVKP